MSAFTMAVDAIFSDPNLTQDAIWRVGGSGPGVPVRIRLRSPAAVVGMGDNRFDLDAMLIDVRLSEIAAPAKNDQADLLDQDGAITMTVVVTGLAGIDRRQLVRTCEVSPLAADDPDEDEGP